jgi:CBS-domain-containing membrane protein
MSKVSEIMTTDVQVIGPKQSLQQAAQLMERMNIGSLPVCDGRRLLGMVTDRDITIRGTAAGLTPSDGRIEEVMTRDVTWCTADQDSAEVLQRMGSEQVRRLPVIDADKQLVGILALGDLATRQPASVEQAVREISAPGEAGGGAANA